MEHDTAYRRFKRNVHQQRRLKRDYNEHYDKLDCACYTDSRIKSFMADTPKLCSCYMCGNPRKYGELPAYERRANEKFVYEARK